MKNLTADKTNNKGWILRKEQNELIEEMNKKQRELVKRAEEVNQDGSLYDFSFVILKRTVHMRFNNRLYTEFSFTKESFEEKANRKINSIQMQINNIQ